MKASHLAVFTLLAAVSASAENWPGFRGPLGTGQSGEKGLPVKWSATEGVKWKAPLPGPGMSSPIVWGSQVFVTQSLDRAGTQRALLCFDRKEGKELWRQVVQYNEKESTYESEPHYCSATPATDGERVVVSYGSAGVHCYDMQGKKLWNRDLGKAEQIWGNAASPVIWGDLVIQNFGPGERTFLLAMDKKTGKDVWKVDKPGKFGAGQPDWTGSWTTPVVAKIQGKDQLIMSWPDTLEAYDPKTGGVLWSAGGLTKLVYSSPIVTPDVVVAMSGFGGSDLAVKTGGSGDITATHRLWGTPKSPQRIGSGVVVGDHIYILNATGAFHCIELQTGKIVVNERPDAAAVWGSTIHADGKLYVTNQRGETFVIAAKPQFELISRNPLGERSQSTPAISNGEIFIRTYGHLWCIGK
jgi:hypothetical protein